MSERIEKNLENLNTALIRLKEALDQPENNPLIVDGTIQRFEFTFELFWKTLKRALEKQGIATTTPREALEQGYKAGWLADEERWLQMLKDRNASSHTYSEDQAKAIYDRIRSNYPELANVVGFLTEKFP